MVGKDKPREPEKPPALWTIILYIAADGILANFAVESLKQLCRSVAMAYSGANSNNNSRDRVVVAAQFAVDAPGGQQIPRYIFDEDTFEGGTGGSIGNGFVEYLNAPPGMTEQEALTSFLQWVFSEKIQIEKGCKAKHYALILWGHGPELLLQPPAAGQIEDPCGNSQNGEDDLYLTPEALRVALTLGLPTNKPTPGMPENKRLDIIAFDTCSMSMFEMAFEIRKLAKYVIASQEEVPDPSFPYDNLVQLFRSKGRNTEELITDGVAAYVAAYQDYICNNVTGMKPVMLSAFRLDCCEPLLSAVHDLACALYQAQSLPCLPGLLVQARACSREFVAGLYVDLKDFCIKLDRILSVEAPDIPQYLKGAQSPGAIQAIQKHNIRRACERVIKALPDDTTPNLFILANSSNDPDCHGVSLYFPYLSNEQYEQIEQPMVKGGRDTTKLSSVVNQAASELLMVNRRNLIIETEGYYEALEFAAATGWYYFIATQWSKILAQMEPNKLDFFHSARQCAVNLCKSLDAPKCKPEPTPQQGQSEPWNLPKSRRVTTKKRKTPATGSGSK